MIGVTGSVGKTTTRHLLFTVLSQQFVGLQNPGNLNNHIGLPLSVLGLAEEHEFAVFELGASRWRRSGNWPGSPSRKSGSLREIAATHLDHFGSVENIVLAKGELLESLPTSGFAVINGDDADVNRLACRFDGRIVRVGEARGMTSWRPTFGLTIARSRFGSTAPHSVSPAIGRHHLNSALLALGVAREVGMSDADIAAGFLRFEAVPGRCRLVTVGEWLVIDDTYNASPASMKAACDALGELEGRAGSGFLFWGTCSVSASSPRRSIGNSAPPWPPRRSISSSRSESRRRRWRRRPGRLAWIPAGSRRRRIWRPSRCSSTAGSNRGTSSS